MSGSLTATVSIGPDLLVSLGSVFRKACPVVYLMERPVTYLENNLSSWSSLMLSLAKCSKAPRRQRCSSIHALQLGFHFLLVFVSLKTVRTIYFIATPIISHFHLVPGMHTIYIFLLKL